MPPRSSPPNLNNISTTPQPPEVIEMNRTHPQILEPKAAAIALGRSALSSLAKIEEPYVDSSVLPKYRVNIVRPLDFRTGTAGGQKHKLSPPSERYLEPMSEKDTLTWLNKYKPWEAQDDIMVGSRQPTGFHEGNFFWILMDIYLTSDKEEQGVGFMVLDTPWLRRGLWNSKFTSRLSDGKHDWSLVAIFQQAKHASGPLLIDRPIDPEKPHVIAVVADSAPLKQDKMSTSELTVSSYLACNVVLSNVHKSHQYFPVTLVTVAHRTIRITQCIFDSVSQSFEIRQTPLVHFENGVWTDGEKGKSVHSDFITLLGWMVGTPVGQTMPH